MTTQKTDPVTMLDRTIRARYPVIAISSSEEGRVEDALKSIADRQKKPMFTWTCALGLTQNAGRAISNAPAADETRDPIAALSTVYNCKSFIPDGSGALFLFKDLHGFSNDPVVTRWVRDIVKEFQVISFTLILVSPAFKVSPDLEKDVAVIDWPLPNQTDIETILDDCILNLPKTAENKLNGSRDKVVRALSGLTAFESSSVLSMAVATYRCLDERAIDLIILEKKAIIKKLGFLEYFDTDITINDIGGLARIKDYARKKLNAFSRKAEAYGLPAPRGFLMVGVPGAGKSLVAKAITGGKVPLVRLDIGALMGGLVGQSESNTRSVLKLIDAIGECVLWIDEIDKGFAGMGGGGDSDGGTSRRVLGTILTWMQEHTSPVYVVATANDISYITDKAPELLRRFDDLWWIDLPNTRERAEIVGIHLAKRKRNPIGFDLLAVARATEGFTGAEIEKVVISALVSGFDDGERNINTADLITAAAETVPVSRTMGENLDRLRAWAKTKAKWASEGDEPPAKTKSEGRGRKVELDD